MGLLSKSAPVKEGIFEEPQHSQGGWSPGRKRTSGRKWGQRVNRDPSDGSEARRDETRLQWQYKP